MNVFLHFFEFPFPPSERTYFLNGLLYYLHAQVRENVGVAVESSSDDRESQLVGNETEGQYLNSVSQGSLQYTANVKYPSNDANRDDICLITETIIPSSGSSDQSRNDENKGIILQTIFLI